MRKSILYISMSLDGYIADSEGGVGWIDECEIPEEVAGSYERFIAGVDTVVMGWNTYHQIVTELSPDRWVYEGLETYVVTHRRMQAGKDIRFTDENPGELARRLRQQEGKDIWICGGACLANRLMAEGLVDMIYLTVLPVALGGGIRLFGEGLPAARYRLDELRRHGDVAEMIYRRFVCS